MAFLSSTLLRKTSQQPLGTLTGACSASRRNFPKHSGLCGFATFFSRSKFRIFSKKSALLRFPTELPMDIKSKM